MKVGDVYTTRDGRTAKVIEIEFDIAAIEMVSKREVHHVFTKTGRANVSESEPMSYDLILPPKTVKKQTLVTLEGPEYGVERYLHDERIGRIGWEKKYDIKISVEKH